MTYPIPPGSPFWAAEIGEAAKHSPYCRTTWFCTDVYCLLSNSSSSSILAPWGKQSNSLNPCLFLIDQEFTVEYELDTFNMTHTGTTLRHPQNWLCRLRCRILLQHLALISPLGNIFWRPHASPRNNQKHKIMVTSTFISSNSKHDFCSIRRT